MLGRYMFYMIKEIIYLFIYIYIYMYYLVFLCLYEQQFENNQQHPLRWGESLMGCELDPMYRKTLFLTELRSRNGLEDKTAVTSDLTSHKGRLLARIIIFSSLRRLLYIYINYNFLLSIFTPNLVKINS